MCTPIQLNDSNAEQHSALRCSSVRLDDPRLIKLCALTVDCILFTCGIFLVDVLLFLPYDKTDKSVLGGSRYSKIM
ncbi:hypothetical protein FWK35_00017999 [Aphis craccivora]|uniref:Uncharacterized protein n=1 Tax=Aphis craccivora TaxID=307492 RepID=A0A6G0ZKM9_APHCR|nr:hypothetical protein FWK35_00017999 [Aphis craccivora]